MQFQYSIYELPLVAAVLISSMVAIYSWRHRTTNGAIPLTVLSLALAEWALHGVTGCPADIHDFNLVRHYE